MKNIKKLINLTCSDSISKRDEASEELCDIIRNKLKYAMGYILPKYAHLFEGFSIFSLNCEINNTKCYPFKTLGVITDIDDDADYSRGYINFCELYSCYGEENKNYAKIPIKWLEVDGKEFDKILDEFTQNNITSLLDSTLKASIYQINLQTEIKKRVEEKLTELNKLK